MTGECERLAVIPNSAKEHAALPPVFHSPALQSSSLCSRKEVSTPKLFTFHRRVQHSTTLLFTQYSRALLYAPQKSPALQSSSLCSVEKSRIQISSILSIEESSTTELFFMLHRRDQHPRAILYRIAMAKE